MDYTVPWNSSGQNTGIGSLLQGLFPTQGSNPGLPHCSRILYQLNHKGSPRILEWVAYPFSRGSSQPRNWTGVSWVAGRFFTNWATREAQLSVLLIKLNSDPRDGIRFHRLKAQPHKAAPSPTPLLQKQVQVVTYMLTFPTTPSLGSVNRAVHGSQRNILLRDHQFVIKGYKSGKAWWRRCTGQGVGKAQGFQALSRDDTPHVPTCSTTQKLCTLSHFTEAPFIGITG